MLLIAFLFLGCKVTTFSCFMQIIKELNLFCCTFFDNLCKNIGEIALFLDKKWLKVEHFTS